MKLIKKLALKLLTAPQQWRLDLINQRCVVFVFVRRVVVAIVVIWDSRDSGPVTAFVDCSKGTIAVSLGQKVVLSFNGYWGKRSE